MNDHMRPDPDALLERVRREDELSGRARLKIFLGASAGVGKTYTMLVEAHERRRAGVDVVVGVVQTHGRFETAALLDGLEVLPPIERAHRDTALSEFDIDGLLRRRPALVLVDELAHTNAPGSRHRKRWQDVEELLDSGIDVYSTLNVQHVESLVDVVAQITGVTVRETVPDSILDRADEVELVDLPPDDLLQRLREGKVYQGPEADRAAKNFFRKGNLIALRELALRQTALRVDAQMESYRRAAGIAAPWAVGERILVCLGNPDDGVRLVRAARRMAAAFRAEWIVAHVETPGHLNGSNKQRDAIIDVMSLAEELGAESTILTGLRVSDELLSFARDRHVTRIVLGKPAGRGWRAWLPSSLSATLLRRSGELDVHVLAGAQETDEPGPRGEPAPPRPVRWRGYASALPVVLLSSLFATLLVEAIDLSDIAMLYLLGVIVVASAFGRGPAILTAFLSVMSFDFNFVPPRFTFAVSDTRYLITFVVMLAVAIVIGTLAARLREQALSARQRERRTSALYQLSRELSSRRSIPDLLESALSRVRDVFDAQAAILLPSSTGRLSVSAGDGELLSAADRQVGVAQWAFDHAQPAGLGTNTLPASLAMHLPLIGSGEALGVLSVRPLEAAAITAPDRLALLQMFANQTAVALERAQLATAAAGARVDAETERARNALLSSVSHDLRTPLAVITGAATGLRDSGQDMSASTRWELADTIAEEGQRLNRLVGELLDMTRLESGALTIHREWHIVEDVVSGVIVRLERIHPGRRVELVAAHDLPLVALDEVLFGQAVHNLVENALRLSPAELPVEVSLRRDGDVLVLEVADRGSGLVPGEESRVFEKFYRGVAARDQRGTGLGLTIARGIMQAHGGEVSAHARPGGGAIFRIELPLVGDPPVVERSAEERPEAE